MSLLKYFKPVDKLPTVEETRLPAQAVSAVNSAVERALGSADVDCVKRKRKYMKTFTGEDRAKVRQYAAENGVTRAQSQFKAMNLSEITICHFKKMYLAEVCKRTKTGDAKEVTNLEFAKCGHKVILGEQLDAEVRQYIQRLRDNGTSISTALVQAAAEGYLLGRDRTVLVQYGGHVSLTMDWACSILIRMGYVKRKDTTKANTKLPKCVYLRLKASFLRETVSIMKIHNIPPELIIDLDETGLQLVPVGDWIVAPEGSKRVEIAGLGDKDKLQLHLLVHSVENSLQSKFFTRAKPTAVTPNILSEMASMFITHKTTGPMRTV